MAGGESTVTVIGAEENLLKSFLPIADKTVSKAKAATIMNAGLKFRFKFTAVFLLNN